MKKSLSIICVALASTLCLAIGSAVVTDTTQPLASLTTLQAWQGAALMVIANVRQNGQPYTNAVTVSMQWGNAKITSPATNGTAIISTGVLTNSGASTYYLSCVDAGVTNALGSGILFVTANAFWR